MDPINLDLTRREMLQAMAVGAAAGVLPGQVSASDAPNAPTSASANSPMEKAGLGAPVQRVDGKLKVTGLAPYAIEHHVEGLAFGVLVQSTIASGRITRMVVKEAMAAPGVIAVYSHLNAPKILPARVYSKGGAATENFLPLQDDRVLWNGQHIGFVVAETLEQATEAAHLIQVEYEAFTPTLQAQADDSPELPVEELSVSWGDAAQAMKTAPVRVDGVYTTPREYNVPLELHACIAAWDGDELTVWEPSQWVGGAGGVIAEWMGIGVDNVHVLSPFIGGGFGSKVSPHPHVAITCAAARALGRPIKTSLTRQQTFTGYGGRPKTRQALSLGARQDGTLVAISHTSWNETAMEDIHQEPCNAVTPLMYAVPNFSSTHSLRRVHTVNPGWLRAPGENPSAYALETAMDELAYALGMDPLELRLKNYAEFDHQANAPWTTRRLKEAYAAGAQAFGWAKRSHQPRSMREGRELIGWGMASGTYPVRRTPGQAQITFRKDGQWVVRSAGIDMGTGTYTILAQTVAEVFGVPTDRVTVLLGDTSLPLAPLAGGSQLANVLVGAVHKAALNLKSALLRLATEANQSPLLHTRIEDLAIREGQIRLKRRPASGLNLAALMTLSGRETVEASGDTFGENATAQDRFQAGRTFKQMVAPTMGGLSAHAWSAQFVEVRVDEDFGTVRVRRMVGAFDSGQVFNPTLARSQWMGGMIMGLGQALLEDGVFDPQTGRVVSASLADYLVAVNADVPEITTISVGVPDLQATALGGKAVGELGIVGVAAAINNAVYHATGKRVRDLPITMDKLLVDS
ncbi:xanthine dehydrogenase YagR molybdenum-binding subunit [Pseudomonas sp. NFACC02]|uniref:xanthine dehydrogenase family protein molybdopterin-binding subunit n=1 Tax=Pseudomonas TaxID=286 RepID=UPI0008B79767|nr:MULTISPECIES: xanthine dehydrogenase family protein molybdopterin-binding subunit [Pseudomonas]SER47926.1 xanthine dehydrogenase YagR molybdenum-binding subunit [Pseudomonas sp. NFACC02]